MPTRACQALIVPETMSYDKILSMAKRINQAELYKTQISLSEWFEKIGHQKTAELRLEDNLKRDRLLILNEIIGLPFDKPIQFKATDLKNKTPQFKKFLKEHGHELCALRLVPDDPKLEKLRMRGLTTSKVMEWFENQKIDPGKYTADFIPHGDTQLLSTIFIINDQGIFGEIIKGGHYQLTQGFYDSGKPITFFHDFRNLTLGSSSKKIRNYLEKIIDKVRVKDLKKQKVLAKKLNAKFAENFLHGYFETVDTSEFGLWFVDYNRILSDLYKTHVIPARRFEEASTLGVQAGTHKFQYILTGQIASTGKVTGIVGKEILVCEMTTPDMVPQMKQAIGIITDFGGILSHAAIISRELKIPCIVGTKNASKILKPGDRIELDAELGVVNIINL